MTLTTPTRGLIQDRAVVSLRGAAALDFLNNLVTADLARLANQRSVHTGLLTPQGKILFEFFVMPEPGSDSSGETALLLDVAADQSDDLIKRLTMYKLRAAIEIVEASSQFKVCCGLDGPSDPRHPGMGLRSLLSADDGDVASVSSLPDAVYRDARIDNGIAEIGHDFAVAGAFPHEANWDLTGTIDFKKGCFIGQEVVSRMQHKALIRKRVARITTESPGVTPGDDVKVGDATIGTVGSAHSNGHSALAMVRVDRVAEAIDKDQPVTASGLPVTLDADVLDRYRKQAAAREAAR